MKKYVWITLSVLGVIVLGTGGFVAASAPREVLNFNATDPAQRLPISSQRFIEEQYPHARVMNVDLELFGYEAYLDNGTVIDFRFNETVDFISYEYASRPPQASAPILTEPSADATSASTAGNWTESATTWETVDASDLPVSIQEYLSSEFPNDAIVRVELDEDGYDIYLSSGLNIDFDHDGSVDVESNDSRDDYEDYDEEHGDDYDEADDDEYEADDDAYDSEDVIIDATMLPEEALNFIRSQYPEADILLVEQDDDGYDIYLSGGIEIDYDFDGTIEVDREEPDRWDDWNDWNDTIDASTLPEVILNYISANYPNANIQRAEFDEGLYEVTLTNGLELTFQSDGTLVDIDVD